MQARTFMLGAMALVIAAAAGPAGAATQGTSGPTSKGSITITASIANRSVASGISDVALGGTSANERICLWSSSSTRGYGLAASGDGPEGALLVDDGAGPALPYAVHWDGAALPAGSRRLGFIATATQPGCRNEIGKANLNVVFLERSDRRSGTLSLLVIPQ